MHRRDPLGRDAEVLHKVGLHGLRRRQDRAQARQDAFDEPFEVADIRLRMALRQQNRRRIMHH